MYIQVQKGRRQVKDYASAFIRYKELAEMNAATLRGNNRVIHSRCIVVKRASLAGLVVRIALR